jgi:hypothetical protein
VELQRKGIVRIFGPASNKSAEYGLHLAQRIDLRTAAQAASETFMALNWVLSAASAAASQQLLLLLPEEEGQNLSVVLSSTGAPACMHPFASVHSGKAREAGRRRLSRSAQMAAAGPISIDRRPGKKMVE